MVTMRPRALILTALLILWAAACKQSQPPVPPQPSAAATPATDVLLRFAVYGDTRDGHDIHRQIVAGVISFHPSLVLQTGDLVRDGSDADQWQIFHEIPGDMRWAVAFF